MRDSHRVAVYRPTATKESLKTKKTVPLVAASAKCLVEELPGRQRESVIGVVSGARYRISWPVSEDIRDQDIVKYDNEWFMVKFASRSTRIGSRRVRQSSAWLEQYSGIPPEAPPP